MYNSIINGFLKSDYDQEIPQALTADQLTVREKESLTVKDIRKAI